MQLAIRRYRASDKDAVLTLFSSGVLEHVRPCFYNAMSRPLHMGAALGLSAAGYLLGGRSLLWALVLGGGWAGLVYYCCSEVYGRYLREQLRSDMQDIPGKYLAQPDCCFWVAEAQVEGGARVLGTVAVVAKQSGVAEGEEEAETYGELFRMNVSSSCRRTGLGSRMTRTAVDFCEGRGFSKAVLFTTSTQTAAVALYKKMGFTVVGRNAGARWMTRLAGVSVLRMEKRIRG